ncbi:hypothetical protein LTR84_002721 [Exophiala bonariae]|uniref:Uncharacterized protein n=1 Tax=Exophiala bonariae TaxID=1690606 RepID=A0AAV9ND66_9EURO|nr:hypothetical protein LTR84_002721 [Exophiala bonariae]
MVKVAENRVIDLDVFPGDPKGDQLAEQTRAAVSGKLPQEGAQGVSANSQSAITALGGTVGGGVKGVVDTLGNTVGALGEGVTGTVQGVGDGVGSTVQFAGGAVGAGAGKLGNMFTGSKQGQSEAMKDQKANLNAESKKTEEIESDIPTSVQEHSKDANNAAKNTPQKSEGLEDQGEDKIAGVSSSSS